MSFLESVTNSALDIFSSLDPVQKWKISNYQISDDVKNKINSYKSASPELRKFINFILYTKISGTYEDKIWNWKNTFHPDKTRKALFEKFKFNHKYGGKHERKYKRNHRDKQPFEYDDLKPETYGGRLQRIPMYDKRYPSWNSFAGPGSGPPPGSGCTLCT
jgi:hypothetical protein